MKFAHKKPYHIIVIIVISILVSIGIGYKAESIIKDHKHKTQILPLHQLKRTDPSYTILVMDSTLFYLAKPTYGGWVTFTAHLHKLSQSPIYKIQNEQRQTNEILQGMNPSIKMCHLKMQFKRPNPLITAVDKHYWDKLSQFPSGTSHRNT